MIHLYDKTSAETSKIITKTYSTSFSLGIKAFQRSYREPIYNIYGFVRIADEIVDTFHGFDKKYLLEKFRNDTFEAIEMGISTNPILHSFQKTVKEYNIEIGLIDAFLKSMEMDLYMNSHEKQSYDEYINGSAEVVGLMCLHVFVQNNTKLYNELKHSAQMLGSAFQKVNFLRDIKDDIEERGRIYLPGVHKDAEINYFDKELFEREIEQEFQQALKGILKLPVGVRLGVYTAYIYYQTLFNKMKGKSIQEIKLRRIRVSNFIKLNLFIKSFFQIRILKEGLNN
ncbi:MAG: phytoene/squalene synthase family protein [Ignavibacteriaceae bacterium]|jgi:phytoene/squalene synthetase